MKKVDKYKKKEILAMIYFALHYIKWGAIGFH